MKIRIFVLACALLPMAIETAAAAGGIVRRPVLGVPLATHPKVAQVEGREITLDAGTPTGLHLHPCDVVGYIVAGSIEFQVEGQPLRVLSPGDAFHEPANAHILHFDAVGGAAKFVAFYLLDRPDHELIRLIER